MPRILVADDDHLIRAILGEALEEAGFCVIEAANGREGIEKLAEHREIDFLLCDIKMPVMGGFALAAEAIKRNPHIKMLMMSGFGGRTLPEVFKARGVEVWRKPIRIQHLIDRVAFLLTNR